MIQNNYFLTNEDLKEHFYELIDWNEIVPIYENNYSDAKLYESTQNTKLEMAPSNPDEATSYYEEILKSCGEISGMYVSQVASVVDAKGLKFENGEVIHPQEMVDVIQMYHDAGLGPAAFKRKYGGLGVPSIIKAMIAELMYRSDSSITIAVGSMGLAAILEVCASEEMKNEWIPKLISGNYTVTMGLSEPDFGSDLPNITTKAIQKDDGWYLSGTKRFQTVACGVNGGPGITLTLARTGSPESGARGLSFFIVENKDYSIQGIEKKLGIKASATCETVFEDSKGYLVGKEGFGLVKYVMGMLNGARLSVSSQGTGIVTAAYEEALKYAKERYQFGKPIYEIPAVKKLLDRMERELAGMRCLMVEAAYSVDKYYWYEDGREITVEENKTAKFWEKVANTLTPISKYYNSEMCNDLVYDGLQVLGGAGYTEDYDLSRLYRDARITNIYDGTTQIQVNAAIGGITSGMSQTGTFRAYLDHLTKGSESNQRLTEIRSVFESIVDAYKSIPDQNTKESFSFEVVESAARLVVGLLMERSKNKSKSRKELRSKWCKEFHIDSFGILTANLIKLKSV
ncbi:putative acyl-CoA dehydrogenase [Leptospira yanagawae serovar Saopaulo str. Sao Paulo = ATCC 700523]|uniref:Putative acyl-CoA dehydrogenase n=1 Tax=Leptospira yanagawae serovar Saopaulo str. Sao Paulo = ATCC 700523 TaxID=1249483 RepID=A0A5E8HHL3_9LEPT|nr:acyl-CoA dehydrogenase family protein [Leptospira yanagawae]EOQ89990.1 putative acyl-CoA dehydrogenase [Leptospira yanagawae serovar Saopaulo str. Sao Paulo = ATCC 700523]